VKKTGEMGRICPLLIIEVTSSLHISEIPKIGYSISQI